MRAINIHASNGQISSWLSNFVQAADEKRTEIGRNADEMRTGIYEGNGQKTDEKRTEIGRETDSRANKVSLFSNQSPDGDGADLAPVRPRRSRREPSVTDLAAYRILDATYPVVAEHVTEFRMTRKRWLTTNKAAALELVEQGTNAEEVVSALLVAYENPRARKYYGNIVMLEKIVQHWAALRAIDDGPSADDELRERALRGEFLPVV